MRSWLLSGPQANWETALTHGTWGVEAGSHVVKQCWNTIEAGDILLFYATKPVKALIGVGIAKATYISDVVLWENDQGKTCEHRVPFEVCFHVLGDEHASPIPIGDVKPQLVRSSVNVVASENAKAIWKRIHTTWRIWKPSWVRRKTVMLRADPKWPLVRGFSLFILGAIASWLIERLISFSI